MSNAAEKQPEPNLSAETVMTWYQVTLSAIGDAVLTTDPEGRVTYMNPVAEALTGWIAAEAHGRPFEEVVRIINEETRAVVEQPVRKVIETGLIRGMANHTLLVAKDGTERPIDDSAAPVRDEAGRLTGVVMVFRDISEQRSKEKAAREALAYAESIIDTVRDPLVVLDGDLRVLSASRSFYETFAVDAGSTEPGSSVASRAPSSENTRAVEPKLPTMISGRPSPVTSATADELNSDIPGLTVGSPPRLATSGD